MEREPEEPTERRLREKSTGDREETRLKEATCFFFSYEWVFTSFLTIIKP